MNWIIQLQVGSYLLVKALVLVEMSIVEISKRKIIRSSFALDKTRSHLQFAVLDLSLSNLGKGLSSYSGYFPSSYEYVTCSVMDLFLQFTLLFTCELSHSFLLMGVKRKKNKNKKGLFKIKASVWKDIKCEIQTHCFHFGFSDHRNLL